MVVRLRNESPAASRVIGPPQMLILSGSTPLYVLLLRGSGTPQYRPSSGCPSGGSSPTTISTLLIAARRSAGQGAQRVVNRLFERIIETRLRTRIHLRNGARIGAGIQTASSGGPCGVPVPCHGERPAALAGLGHRTVDLVDPTPPGPCKASRNATTSKRCSHPGSSPTSNLTENEEHGEPFL